MADRLTIAAYVQNPTQTNAIHAAYVQGLLRDRGMDVHIIDPCFEKDPLNAAKQRIEEMHPDVLGLISDLFNPCCSVLGTSASLGLAEWAKKRQPNILVAMDGIYPTAKPEVVLSSGVDFAVKGESDITYRELFLALERGEGPETVDGLSYLKGGKIEQTKPRQLIDDLDILPLPDRSIFDQRFFFSGKEIDIVSGRGCPYSCTICQPVSWMMYGRKTRYRSVGNVLQEVELVLPGYYRPGRLIDFQMDTLTVNKAWVRELCEQILARGLKFDWRAGTRFDSIDPELLRLMKQAGCRLIGAGLESGSRRIREGKLRKGLKDREILAAGRLMRREGLALDTAVIVGLDGEGPLDVVKTCWSILRLNPDKLFLPTAVPVPGTDMYEEALKLGRLKPHNPEFFTDYSLITGDDSLYSDVSRRRIRTLRRIYSYTWKLGRGLRDPGSLRRRERERWQQDEGQPRN